MRDFNKELDQLDRRVTIAILVVCAGMVAAVLILGADYFTRILLGGLIGYIATLVVGVCRLRRIRQEMRQLTHERYLHGPWKN